MPIYEYKCEKCNNEFELFRNISDEGTPPCKFCDGPVRKLISQSSFHLKGTGWYVTDYAGKKSSIAEEKKESSSDASSSTGKTEESSPKKKSEGSSD
jgi:putative FmdB family regulatory protein